MQVFYLQNKKWGQTVVAPTSLADYIKVSVNQRYSQLDISERWRLMNLGQRSEWLSEKDTIDGD